MIIETTNDVNELYSIDNDFFLIEIHSMQG